MPEPVTVQAQALPKTAEPVNVASIPPVSGLPATHAQQVSNATAPPLTVTSPPVAAATVNNAQTAAVGNQTAAVGNAATTQQSPSPVTAQVVSASPQVTQAFSTQGAKQHTFPASPLQHVPTSGNASNHGSKVVLDFPPVGRLNEPKTVAAVTVPTSGNKKTLKASGKVKLPKTGAHEQTDGPPKPKLPPGIQAELEWREAQHKTGSSFTLFFRPYRMENKKKKRESSTYVCYLDTDDWKLLQTYTHEERQNYVQSEFDYWRAEQQLKKKESWNAGARATA